MDNIEVKRLKVEYKRVNAAREEMECKIMEFHEQIKRLESNIEISKAREEELQAKQKDLEGKLARGEI